MLRIGDMVVHSLHGLGVVESIEEKVILGRVTRFSVVAFEFLKIMINVDQSSSLVRPLIELSQVEGILEFLKEPANEEQPHYNRRYNINLERMKSGNIHELCSVIKSLSKLGHNKKLSYKDQSLREKAREVLAQELAHLKGTTVAEMQVQIDANCQCGLELALTA